MARPPPPPKVGSGRFECEGKKLGAGCFGEVFLGKDTATGDKVAIKTEDWSSESPQLEKEYKMLVDLRTPSPVQGFVEVFYCGHVKGRCKVMVMELLDETLEDMIQNCRGRFTPKTTSLVATQVLHRIEHLHSKGLVHRDIKPENFMFGTRGKMHIIYLIDFGLSKRYWDKKHVAMRTKLNLTGTARYVSVNTHKGLEQSRRDDLEAIGHMFLYFLRGSLPWSGLDAKTREEKYKKILHTKETTPLSELCNGFPKAFEDYMRYVRDLGFETRPDYDSLQESFKAVQQELRAGTDWDFQWFEKSPPHVPLVPLELREPILQPDDGRDSAAEGRDSGGEGRDSMKVSAVSSLLGWKKPKPKRASSAIGRTVDATPAPPPTSSAVSSSSTGGYDVAKTDSSAKLRDGKSKTRENTAKANLRS